MKHILVLGDPITGFKYRGPFSSDEAALKYAEYDRGLDIDFWIAPIYEPGEIESINSGEISAEEKSDKEDDEALIIKLANFYKDKIIRHKDGNIRNYDISNLEIVTKKTLTVLPSYEEIIAEEESENKSLPGIEQNTIDDLEDIPF